MTRVDPHAKALLVARLRERRRAGEPIGDEVRRVAGELEVGARTVWRWVAEFTDTDQESRSDRYELTDADVDAFTRWQGNVAAVHRELHAGRPGGLSVRRLQRAFAAQLTPGQRAGLVDGAEGRRRYEVYLRWAPPARNAMWEGDHVELPVLVLAPRAQRPVKPWATVFIDGFSRLVMGWAISLRPNSGTVLAALRGGIVIDPARGPFGGVPAVLRTDHGLEFTAAALRRSCAALGVELVPAPAYTPHLKGKVERWNRTLVQAASQSEPTSSRSCHASTSSWFPRDRVIRGRCQCRRAAEAVSWSGGRREGRTFGRSHGHGIRACRRRLGGKTQTRTCLLGHGGRWSIPIR